MATERKHSETRQRTRLVGVRMNPAESALLTAEAARTGEHESTLLRDAFLASSKADEVTAAYEDLLGSVWPYVNWRYLTKQLTTQQKNLFADAVDAHSVRLHDGIGEPSKADRWWRDDADGS